MMTLGTHIIFFHPPFHKSLIEDEKLETRFIN